MLENTRFLFWAVPRIFEKKKFSEEIFAPSRIPLDTMHHMLAAYV